MHCTQVTVEQRRGTHHQGLSGPIPRRCQVSGVTGVKSTCEAAIRPGAAFLPQVDTTCFVRGILPDLRSRGTATWVGLAQQGQKPALARLVRSPSLLLLLARAHVPITRTRRCASPSERPNSTSADWYAAAENPNWASVATLGGLPPYGFPRGSL